VPAPAVVPYTTLVRSGAADAIMEAADAGIAVIVAITEGIPVLDMARAMRFLKQRPAALVGPNCPGVITPGQLGPTRAAGGWFRKDRKSIRLNSSHVNI